MNERWWKGRSFGMFRKLHIRGIAILQAIGWYSFQQIEVRAYIRDCQCQRVNVKWGVDQCFRSFDASQNQRLPLWTLSWTRVGLSIFETTQNFGNDDWFWILSYNACTQTSHWICHWTQTQTQTTHISHSTKPVIEEGPSSVTHFGSDRIVWSTLSVDRFVSVTCVNQSAPIAITRAATTTIAIIRATTVLQEGMASKQADQQPIRSLVEWNRNGQFGKQQQQQQ